MRVAGGGGFMRRYTIFLCLFMPVFMTAPYADTDNGDASRGRQIFLQGEKLDGEPLTANVGAASFPVPASALPCTGCHGRDGAGREEGGVKPSNITWYNLTRPYGGTTEMGRKYQAYNEDSFLNAVTLGVDSSGNRLDTTMPRYNISRRDARDLVAYLKVIAEDYDPGSSDDEIVIGTLQPTRGIEKELGDAMLAVIESRFAEINRQGGIYNRKLALEVRRFENRQSFPDQVGKLIDSDRVFALLNVFSANADPLLTELAEQGAIPSIAPYTQFPGFGEAGRFEQSFYLHGGLYSQVAVLARRIAMDKTFNSTLVLYEARDEFRQAAEHALKLLEADSVKNPRMVAFDRDSDVNFTKLLGTVPGRSTAIMFLGNPRDFTRMAGNPPDSDKAATLYLPGYFVTRDVLSLPGAYAQRMEMVYTTIPGNNSGAELSGFRAFMQRNQLPYDFLTARLYAFAASELIIEGIKRAGKRIRRKNLVTALEQVYDFDIGLNKRVSFASRKRVGLRGGFIVRMDMANRRLMPSDMWVRLD